MEITAQFSEGCCWFSWTSLRKVKTFASHSSPQWLGVATARAFYCRWKFASGEPDSFVFWTNFYCSLLNSLARFPNVLHSTWSWEKEICRKNKNEGGGGNFRGEGGVPNHLKQVLKGPTQSQSQDSFKNRSIFHTRLLDCGEVGRKLANWRYKSMNCNLSWG